LIFVIRCSNVNVRLANIEHQVTNPKHRITDIEKRTSNIELKMNIFERQQQHLQEIMKNEIERGMAFLAENAKRPEVTETASGLQYEVLVEGTGEKPSGPRANVLTHYHGTTIDGVVFDSSVLRNEPISFGLNQVITGWTEGLQLMPVGSKYKFFIPHHLAYGERGAGRDIPGGATLIFEVELLKTK
jgi:FKBP-type peptidyl-prolyl cis-trans isomerase